jgi:hypothetical protein
VTRCLPPLGTGNDETGSLGHSETNGLVRPDSSSVTVALQCGNRLVPDLLPA